MSILLSELVLNGQSALKKTHLRRSEDLKVGLPGCDLVWLCSSEL